MNDAPSRLIGRSLRLASNFLVPPSCVACQRPLAAPDALCAPCWQTITFIRAPMCDRLGIPLPYDTGETTVSAKALAEPPDYDRARAVGEHAGTLRELVIGLKYRDRFECRRLFGRWMAQSGRDLIETADIIIPVPLHRLRFLQRRFNQSAVLAKEISRLTGVPVAYSVLKRTKRTRRQVELTGRQRLHNPRGAFAVKERDQPKIAGRRVLLIDDVITTGATVNACARALTKAGASGVDVLAVSLANGRTDKVGEL